MKRIFPALTMMLLGIGLALAQTTGEQRFMGDVQFDNPVTIDDTLKVTGAVTHDAALTQTGAATLSSTLAVTSTSTFTGTVITNGLRNLGRHTYTGIYASSGLVPTSSYVQMTSSSGLNIALTSTPHISTAAFAIGTYLIFTSTAAGGIIFTDEGTLADSAMELGADTRTVNQYDALHVILTDQGTEDKWVEVSYIAN